MTLDQTLAEVRKRITRYRGSQKLGEQNTKATLIEPLLRELGWDVEDYEEVRREFKLKPRDKPVDYALFSLRNPRLFIEAKALGENLDDRKWASQIMGYASVAGAEWIVLTDGDEYRIYNGYAAVNVDEKLFRAVRLSVADSLAEETLGLLTKERMEENRIEVLWRAQFIDRQVGAAIEELFEGPEASLIRMIGKRTKQLSSKDIKASLGRCQVQLEFPLQFEVSPSRTAGPTAPAHASPR